MSLIRAYNSWTFDDFSLVPQHSDIKSRKEPDTTTIICNEKLSAPIISAPMNSVTEGAMAAAMRAVGADAVVHRFKDTLHQFYEFDEEVNPWMAIGASGDYLERANTFYESGVRKFCIDVANGHSAICIEAVKHLRRGYPDVVIMAGNVCTYEGAYNLARANVDVLRVGVGCGAACSTRLVTGFGVPQLTAIEWCAPIKEMFPNISIVADGGIRCSGDIVKALAAGADAVMIGGLLAGSEHTPGEPKFDPIERRLFKYYRGMASKEGRSEWFEGDATTFVPEGESMKVPYTGENSGDIVLRLTSALKVGMSYAGAHTLKELREKVKWARITENGRKEGTVNRRMFK